MSEGSAYIYKTNYFHRSWTWVKRGMVLLYFIMMILYSELAYPGGLVWKCSFFITCGIFLFLKPKDDLAIDAKYFYHLRTSIQPFFSRIDKYEIGKIKSIRVGGIYSRQFEIMELLGFGFSNSIEIIFKNNSSIILNLPIYKKELVFLVAKVRELMAKND